MRQIALAAALCFAATSWAGAQDAGIPKSIDIASGSCTAVVAGTDVGCSQKVTYSLLSNGHRMFDFPAKDLATVGFAGEKVDDLDPQNPILWIERVYLANNVYDADGQCSFGLNKGETFHKVECKALLHDGRKVSASLDGKAGTPIKLPPNTSTATSLEPAQCDSLVKLHGMLTRAQFQCGYGKYNRQLIDDVRTCVKNKSEAQFKDLLAKGFRLFDTNEREKGHRKICAQILHDFPQYVRR